MNLNIIQPHHIRTATQEISEYGITDANIFDNYWVLTPEGLEFPYQEVMQRAYALAGGESFDIKTIYDNRIYISELGFEIKYFEESLNTIQKEEVALFSNIAGSTYSRISEQNRKQAQRIKPLVRKLNLWAEKSVPNEFVFKRDNSWKWSTNFKRYLWIRIYRPNDSQKVYFVLGCENNELYAEINCNRENTNPSHLDIEIVNRIDEYLNQSSYEPIYIKAKDLQNYSWSKLIERTKIFIQDHIHIYDDLEKIATQTESSSNQSEPIRKAALILSDSPNKIKSYQDHEPTFEGKEIDWNKRNKKAIDTGNAGEQLVIEFEKDRLKDYPDLAVKVKKQLDGAGYDILSFETDGTERYIEVKTTSAGRDEPFVISTTELKFAKKKANLFVIYRLFNFKRIHSECEYYILSANELLSMEASPLSFEISTIKKNK